MLNPPLEPPAAATTARDWRTPLAVLLLLATTLTVFGRVCWHEFTWWDDQMTIHHNPRYNPPSGEKIAETWRQSVDGLYVPVTYSYWGALAYAAELPETDAFGIHLNPRVFHLGSLVLHLASVIVVFSILRLLCGHVWAALGGAMLFAIHPVQVEPVAWASGAKDLLCGLLSLCAIYQYILYARAETARKRWTYYASGALVLVLAMLSKPLAMVVPVVVAVIDLLILRRSWKAVGWSAAGWAVVVLPLAIVAWIAQTADPAATVAVWQRPLIAADAVTFYLWKLIWPVAMAPDYARRPSVVLQMWGGAWLYVIWVLPAALAFWMWQWRAQRPWVLAGAAIFVLGIGPVLGLVPFMFQYCSTVADHYLYLSMLGPAMGVAWLIVRFPRRGTAVACAVAAIALGVRANVQLGHWQTDRGLWAHTLRVSPDSFIAPTNRACELARGGVVLARRAGELREQGDASRAEALDADRQRCFEQAVDLLEQALRIKPSYVPARHNAFINCLRVGKPLKAVQHLEILLKANEGAPAEIRSQFATFHDTAGQLWMKGGRPDRAAEHFEKLLAAMPDHETGRASLEKARAAMMQANIDPRPQD